MKMILLSLATELVNQPNITELGTNLGQCGKFGDVQRRQWYLGSHESIATSSACGAKARATCAACRHRLTAAENFMASVSNGAGSGLRSAQSRRVTRSSASHARPRSTTTPTLADTSPYRGQQQHARGTLAFTLRSDPSACSEVDVPRDTCRKLEAAPTCE